MKYRITWDNGTGACGTFPQTFDTYEEADASGQAWADESNARDGLTDEDEGYSYDVLEVTEPMCCICGEAAGTVADDAGNLACAECADAAGELARRNREWKP